MTGSYIFCNKLHNNGLMTDLGSIPLPRRMPFLHISHQPLQTFVTIQPLNEIVIDNNSAFRKKIVKLLTFFCKLLFSNR